jgi:adenylate cyclase
VKYLKATNFARGIGVRQIRLVCGLILFCYLLSHYINHSLGNVSLDAMEYGLWFHVALWLPWPGVSRATRARVSNH